jgi:hypothetical protein
MQQVGLVMNSICKSNPSAYKIEGNNQNKTQRNNRKNQEAETLRDQMKLLEKKPESTVA